MQYLSAMDPFAYDKRERGTEADVRAYLRERTGALPVLGFAEPADLGGGTAHEGRTAFFFETWPQVEYLLRLDADAGMAWRTHPAPDPVDADRVVFAFALGFGNGGSLPEPSGQWTVSVNDRPCLAVRMVNHRQLWRGPECRLAFAPRHIQADWARGGLTLSPALIDEAQAAFGIALLEVPAAWVAPGEAAVLRLDPVARVPSRRWVWTRRADNLLWQANPYEAIDLLAGARPTVGGHTLYFGEIHTHSDECDNGGHGCGTGTREENYAFARGAGGVDFFALTDHERQVDPDREAAYFALADRHQEEGAFVCLPAFEHTSPVYGHRNVYFGASGGRIVHAMPGEAGDPAGATDPQTLWRDLETTGLPFLTVPHHPSSASHPYNWATFDPRYDRLVEIYSVWGSSAYHGDFPRGVSDRHPALGVQAALARGLRFGLIASSDGHDGNAGDAQSPLVKHHHQFHALGSGRAVVLAEALTRSAVFDALAARRCYATTGAPIVLDVRMGEALLGAETPALESGRPVLRIRCLGTNGIDHLRILRNGRVAATLPMHGEPVCEIEWADEAYNPTAPAAYGVRVVQVDRESAWSSPIFVG